MPVVGIGSTNIANMPEMASIATALDWCVWSKAVGIGRNVVSMGRIAMSASARLSEPSAAMLRQMLEDAWWAGRQSSYGVSTAGRRFLANGPELRAKCKEDIDVLLRRASLPAQEES